MPKWLLVICIISQFTGSNLNDLYPLGVSLCLIIGLDKDYIISYRCSSNYRNSSEP